MDWDTTFGKMNPKQPRIVLGSILSGDMDLRRITDRNGKA